MDRLAPLRVSVSYRSYRRLLEWHRQSRSAALRSAFEAVLKTAVVVGSRVSGWSFPPSASPSWRWSWLWRLEVLAGWAERPSVTWCRGLVRPGMRVLDVGAHIGYYTRSFSRLVGPAGRVWAFEPHPANLALLRRNVSRRNVTLVPAAVSDRTGRARLHLATGSSNHSLVEGFGDTGSSLEVEVVALDDWFERGALPPVDFVKVDVEGAEPRVLTGMSRTLAASPGAALLVEMNARALGLAGSSPAALVEQLRALGFDPRVVRSNGMLSHPEENGAAGDEEPVNLLCVRRGANGISASVASPTARAAAAGTRTPG